MKAFFKRLFKMDETRATPAHPPEKRHRPQLGEYRFQAIRIERVSDYLALTGMDVMVWVVREASPSMDIYKGTVQDLSDSGESLILVKVHRIAADDEIPMDRIIIPVSKIDMIKVEDRKTPIH